MAWMLLWWLLGAALIAALVWGALRLARGAAPPAESPEEILRRRYARGEIDDDTFQRMRAALER